MYKLKYDFRQNACEISSILKNAEILQKIHTSFFISVKTEISPCISVCIGHDLKSVTLSFMNTESICILTLLVPEKVGLRDKSHCRIP